MGYRYRSRRSIRRLARKSQRNFIITLILISILIYSTVTWVLPFFIGGVGFIKNFIKPSQKTITRSPETGTLAPPVLNIPYEATNSAQIDIKGFATPDSKVKLYLDGEPNETVDVSNDGSFVFEDVSLSLGTNNIYGKTLDEQNKESLPSKTIQVKYTYDKPDLTINQPEDNQNIQGGDKKVTISGKTDPKVKIFINGSQVIVGGDGSFSNEQPLNDGENILTIKAIDAASNTTQIQRLVNYMPTPSPQPSP